MTGVFTRRALATATAMLAAGVLGLNALPAHPAEGAKTPKVLVVGLDGVNWGKVVEANAPTLDNLAATGTLAQSLLYCDPVAPSKSGPGWSTVASGVWPDKHRVRDNDFTGARFDLYPDFLTTTTPAVGTAGAASTPSGAPGSWPRAPVMSRGCARSTPA